MYIIYAKVGGYDSTIYRVIGITYYWHNDKKYYDWKNIDVIKQRLSTLERPLTIQDLLTKKKYIDNQSNMPYIKDFLNRGPQDE